MGEIVRRRGVQDAAEPCAHAQAPPLLTRLDRRKRPIIGEDDENGGTVHGGESQGSPWRPTRPKPGTCAW